MTVFVVKLVALLQPQELLSDDAHERLTDQTIQVGILKASSGEKVNVFVIVENLTKTSLVLR